MGRAKDIRVMPIAAKDANALVKRWHYSGKVVNNSQLHLGVFLDGKCGGVMQFGPSLDKRKIMGLVEGTGWNEFIELNRMAFADWLPRNSESRAIGYAFRWMRKQYPHIKWCVSFADGTQCGDGTIYRASGFVLTSVKVNDSMWEHTRTGERRQDMQFFHTGTLQERKNGLWRKVQGHMLRYLYFIDPTARQRLTVPILPFSEIEKRGAGMYRGKPKTSAGSSTVERPTSGGEAGGSIPTPALNSNTA